MKFFPAAILLLLPALLVSGCAEEKEIGICPQGYTWCEAERSCIRPGDRCGLFTEEGSRAVARDFVSNSSTYRYDGFDLFPRGAGEKCGTYCWTFVYEFDSRHAGYGDRSGMMLAEVITPHSARVAVDRGNVTYAVLDGKWDMLSEKEI